MLEIRAGLIEVALGRKSPHTIIRNIRLVNVYSGEILDGQEVAVWHGRIAYVGPEARAGEGTEVVDGQGMYLVPGFIDVHGHADFITNPLSLAGEIMLTGTTAILTETHDICMALGANGLEFFLKYTDNIPFRYYVSVPAANPPLPEFEGDEVFTQEIVEVNLAKPRVLAVGEVTAWGRLMVPERDFLAKIVSAAEQGKRIEGHMAGCSYEKLNALTACGFTSCHESITSEEALNRLRLGLYVILRHGSIRADLEPLSRLITENPGLDTSRIMISPDWFNPMDVLKYGYLNYLVAYAVELGIPAVKAIQMVTINPATYLGLDREIGGIAPGRLADFMLVKDLARPDPVRVWVGGKAVAENGKLLIDIPRFPAADLAAWRTGRVPQSPVRAENFQIKRDMVENIEVPCMHMVNKTITKTLMRTLSVTNGLIDLPQDLMKISLWSPQTKSWVTGFLSGFGARMGGYASSVAHETHMPMVVGSNDEDMALAANRMLEIGGGIVIVEAGQVMGEIPMATGGILSNASLRETAAGWAKLNHYLQETGCPFDDPLFGLGFLSFTGLPYVRITPSGIVDIRNKELVFS
ncbi:MAG: adenine deaminase C-terminal domain-containing protein [Desulfitobacteriaceae bacterium]